MIYAQVLTQEHVMENWKLLKNISNEQPQAERNIILSENGNLAVNDEQAADLLDLHYQKISRLNFSVEDKHQN
ncbi:hypothetical protein TNCV_3843211 [Trichonephila clavipes]|nr:hypothetical protein TNCV_3843211 [Trichonephila clavipes]